ncbi:thiamine phosphate synthase [Niallia sp. 03133]|uniref:thiamine phosphate synthase n=1 Tax=Niallia sp. 03133 TaxID=3458060 RepID=UPI0040448890
MKLMAVTDDQHSIDELSNKILKIHNFLDYIQIREKKKSAQEVYTLCMKLLEEGVDKKKIVINDRVDVALLLNIPTIHLPGAGLPITEVKKKFPEKKIGIPVHSMAEAKSANSDGADYVLYGHCFQTNSKKGKPPVAIESITQIKKEVSIPLFVIGGITEERVGGLHQYGVDGIAVMSAIFSAPNPLEAVKKLHERCMNIESQI